jgi:hypothetical protein
MPARLVILLATSPASLSSCWPHDAHFAGTFRIVSPVVATYFRAAASEHDRVRRLREFCRRILDSACTIRGQPSKDVIRAPPRRERPARPPDADFSS